MSFLIGEIVANVRADTGQFKRGMRDVERTGARSSRNTQRSLGGIGNKLKSIAFLAKTAFVTSMVMGARQAVREFAELEGAMMKFNVVFGDQAKEVEAWVNEFREGVPLARREIVQAAASMQDLLVPMGVAREDASEMTKEWLELSAALAAFNDVPVDQALEAIRSGIAGQSRPLRQFGIDARETALQQTALAHGLMRAGEQMNDQVRQKALLIRAYDQSSDAVDGYEDQLGSTLMMEQELGAQFKDTLAIIGEGLQPSYNSLIATMTDLLNVTKALGNEGGSAIQTYLDIILHGVGAFDERIPSVARLIGKLTSLAGEIGTSAQAARRLRNELDKGLMGDLNPDEMAQLLSSLSSEISKMESLAKSMGIDAEDFLPLQELIGNAHSLGAILQRILERPVKVSTDTEDLDKIPPTVRDLKQQISDLEDSIDDSFDSSEIRGFKGEIEELEKRIAGMMGELSPEKGIEKPMVDLEESVRAVNRSLTEMFDILDKETDFSEFFDVGSIGAMREEIDQLEQALIRTTDPEKSRSLQEEIDRLTEKINEMRNGVSGVGDELQNSTGAARFFSRTLGDGLDQVLFKARSVEDVLKGIARQLASRALTTLLMGAFTGGFGGSFVGAMFGGFRSSGGDVQAGKAYRFNENNQQEMFLPSTNGQIISPQQMSSQSISPTQMEQAFSHALSKHIRGVSGRKIFEMAEHGRFS